MFKILFYLIVIMYLISMVTYIAAIIYTDRGKKMTLDCSAYNALLDMLNVSEKTTCNGNLITKSKTHNYHPLKNAIGIISFDSKTVSNIVPSLHEGGHYLSVNQSRSKYLTFCTSQIFVAFNRLVIIPLFLLLAVDFIKISFFQNRIVLTILIVIFGIASFLRIFVGIYEEYRASKIAMNYIADNFDKKVVNYAKRYFVFSFLSQCFLSLTIITSVPIIYALV